MSQEFANPPSRSLALPKPWHQIWWTALTRPSVAAYVALADDPHATSQRAYGWLVWSGLISGALFGMGFSRSADLPFPGLCFGLPLGALAGLLAIAFMAWITQRIASALGGSGAYSRLVYLLAAFNAPLMLVSMPLNSFSHPALSVLSIGLGLYGLALTVLSVKAVNRFGWGRAIGSCSPLLAVTLCLLALGALAIVLDMLSAAAV